jgi:hypothetical protein
MRIMCFKNFERIWKFLLAFIHGAFREFFHLPEVRASSIASIIHESWCRNVQRNRGIRLWRIRRELKTAIHYKRLSYRNINWIPLGQCWRLVGISYCRAATRVVVLHQKGLVQRFTTATQPLMFSVYSRVIFSYISLFALWWLLRNY